jgi:hypothetical protein
MSTEQTEFWNASRTVALGMVTLVAFLVFIWAVSP